VSRTDTTSVRGSTSVACAPERASVLGGRLRLWGIAFVMLSACAETASKPSAYPPLNLALCRRYALESTEHPEGEDRNTALLSAVYTFDEPGLPKAKRPIQFAVQHSRTRRTEPQKSLESQPDVLCGPDVDPRDLNHEQRPTQRLPQPDKSVRP
jgi:hypothetical protein